MKERIKTVKGITLIALVITIIVLLILAGVTIATLTGENGILSKATEAKTENIAGQEEEQVKMAYSAALAQKINEDVLAEDVQNELENMMGENKTECKDNDGSIEVKFRDTGNRYVISNDGNVINQGSLTYAELSSQIGVDNYGDFVDYGIDLNDDGDTTNDWKIFYAENGNTFIIAADYLLYDKVPENAETREITGDGYDYSVRWLDPSNNGSTDISSSVADKFKFTWLDEGRESDEGNIKVATVLLNTSIWSEFASGIEGAEAIGTPTLEMFIASWNQKYSDSKLYYAINEENDYLVGNTENPTTAQVLMNTSEGYNDELYYPHQEDYHNCWGYWLVAPNSTRYLMTVEYGGSIMATTGYNNDMEVSSCLESLWYRNSSSCMFTFNSKRSK